VIFISPGSSPIVVPQRNVTLRKARYNRSVVPLARSIRHIADQDQIIDATMARSIQADAARTHPLLAWVIVRSEAAYPGQFVARLVTDAITPYVLLADTLGELHAKLPPGLVRSDHQPAGPGVVMEIWFPSAG
jgi:hypothetical protein